MRKATPAIAVVLIGLVALALAIPAYFAFGQQEWSKFWAFTFIDALDLLVTSAFGLFVAWVLTQRISNDMRRRETMYGACARIEELADAAVHAAHQYAEKPLDVDRETRVKAAFQECTKWLSVVQENKSCQEDLTCLYRIKTTMLGLKRAATDDPFGKLTPALTAGYRDNIGSAHQRLIREIFQQRVELF